jgi:hypothetical protein
MENMADKRSLYSTQSQAWGIWVSVLFFLSWLDKIRFIYVPYVGDLAIVLLSISMGIPIILDRLKKNKVNASIVIISSLIGILIIIYIIAQILLPIKSNKPILQLILILFYFIGAAYILPRPRSIRIIANLWIVFSILNLILWMSSGFERLFQGIFVAKNLFGSLIAFGLYFIWTARLFSHSNWWWNFGIFTSLVSLVSSGARIALSVVILSMFVYVFWPLITKNRIIFALVFLGFFCVVLITPIFYINLTSLHIYPQIVSAVRRFTGQNLYSGRQMLWPTLLTTIQNNPWGIGPGALPNYFMDTNLSSHNLYMQITLQVGYAGLVIIGTIFAVIWSLFFKHRYDPVIRLTGGFLLGILAHEAFGVNLTQNNLTAGIVIWSILAIGVGRHIACCSKKYKNCQNEEQYICV